MGIEYKSHKHDVNRPFGSESRGSKDQPPGRQALLLGIGAPLVLVLWAIFNWYSGRAFWPVSSKNYIWATATLQAALAFVKLSVAVGCFGQYYMGSRKSLVAIAQGVALLGFGGAVVGLIACLGAFIAS